MTISTTLDAEAGVHRLIVSDGRLSDAPAGPRLFRDFEPHPEIQFEHETQEGAEASAVKLRAYLAALPPAKPRKRKHDHGSYQEGD